MVIWCLLKIHIVQGFSICVVSSQFLATLETFSLPKSLLSIIKQYWLICFLLPFLPHVAVMGDTYLAVVHSVGSSLQMWCWTHTATVSEGHSLPCGMRSVHGSATGIPLACVTVLGIKLAASCPDSSYLRPLALCICLYILIFPSSVLIQRGFVGAGKYFKGKKPK